jgi:hypothetical protein
LLQQGVLLVHNALHLLLQGREGGLQDGVFVAHALKLSSHLIQLL